MSDTSHVLGFQAQIAMDVESMPDRLKFPDRTNRGKSIALLSMWRQTQQIAEKKYAKLLKDLVEQEVIDDPNALDVPGNHLIAESGKFVISVNVSVPRREFNADWLSNRMMKDYKVPVSITKQLIEEAKRPGTTQVRRITITERS